MNFEPTSSIWQMKWERKNPDTENRENDQQSKKEILRIPVCRKVESVNNGWKRVLSIGVLICLLAAFSACDRKTTETSSENNVAEQEKKETEKEAKTTLAESEKQEKTKEESTSGVESSCPSDLNGVDLAKADGTVIIELDPGHGGSQSGAEYEPEAVPEKEVNLKIARFLKSELEDYENVKVFLTREKDQKVELEDRVKKAVADKADVLISLHNNATGLMADYDHGCTVLTGRGAYNRRNSQTGQELGCYILKELSDIGLENQGLMFRICQNQTTYPNGQLCDYYSIVRNAELSGIPGIIVEHSFIDHSEEYQKYLSDDEKIQALAQADARGIASYYQLKSKTKSKAEGVELKNYKEKITLITSDDKKDNRYMTKTYFQK